MIETVAAILNPISGSTRLTGRIRSLATRLAARGIRCTLHQTEYPGHGTTLARELAATADAILAVGGDGTIREVAAGVAGTRTPLAVFPSGTENIFARVLGARPDPDLLLRTLTAGRTRLMDVGLINGSHFLVVVGVGLDAEVVRRLARKRAGHITHLDYIRPIWRTFWEHRFPRLRVVVDGEELFDGRGLAFVGNLKRYAINLRLLRDAVSDDGLLDLCIFPCSSQGKLLVHAANVLLRRHVEHGGVIYRQCRQVTIDSPESVPVEVDGDLAGHLPIELSILPAAVRFLLPPTQ